MRKLKADGKRDILAILIFGEFQELSDPLIMATNKFFLILWPTRIFVVTKVHLLPQHIRKQSI